MLGDTQKVGKRYVLGTLEVSEALSDKSSALPNNFQLKNNVLLHSFVLLFHRAVVFNRGRW